MMAKIGPALAAVTLFLAVACSTAATPIPTPTPNERPAAAPVSSEARQSAQQFVSTQRRIEQDWEQFHADFDLWRAGLTSCEPSAAQTALRNFAGDFAEITQLAGKLPRSSTTRKLADQLVEAAKSEEAALRQLRDRWQPDSISLFEAVESKRSESISAQQSAADELADLRESTDPESLDDAKAFSSGLEAVTKDWEAVHEAFNSVRDDQENLTASETASKLGETVNDLKGVISAIDDLPSSDTTESMAADLKTAAEAEEKALTELKTDFDELEDSTDSDSEPSFSNAEARVTTSTNAVKEVDDELKSILEDSSADKIGDIDTFRQEYDLLVDEWSAFHDEYNEWRRTEGGCDRAEVSKQLSELSLRFSEIARRVNNLPQESFLRPIGNSLAEAVQREQEALRVLRNTWRPFATDAYRALDQERTNALRLRRQAGVGVQELIQRFEISEG